MDDELTITLAYDEVIAETVMAWLLQFGDDQEWLPKSKCCLDGDDVGDGHGNYGKGGLVDIPEWLAEKKGLEAYEV